MSKFSKFRNSPERFFADSKRAPLRAFGRWVGLPSLRNERLLAVLENPVDAVADSGLPVLESFSRTAVGHPTRRRREMLANK
jgi:hypothetical protein